MDNTDDIKVAFDTISIAIDLPETKHYDHASLLMAIRSRVEQLLEADPNLLFSYLYRLDVLECDIKAVLSGRTTDDVIGAVSQLILDRQLMRLKTKQQYKQDPIEGWSW